MHNPAEAAIAVNGGAQRQQDGSGRAAGSAPNGSAPLKTGQEQSTVTGRPPDSTVPDSGKRAKRRRRRKGKKPYTTTPKLSPAKDDDLQGNAVSPTVDKPVAHDTGHRC